MRAQLRRMPQPSGLDDFLQRMQRVVVEVEYAIGLVRHHQRALAHRVLGRDASRTAAGMAGLRLNAAQGYDPQKTTIALDVSEYGVS